MAICHGVVFKRVELRRFIASFFLVTRCKGMRDTFVFRGPRPSPASSPPTPPTPPTPPASSVSFASPFSFIIDGVSKLILSPRLSTLEKEKKARLSTLEKEKKAVFELIDATKPFPEDPLTPFLAVEWNDEKRPSLQLRGNDTKCWNFLMSQVKELVNEFQPIAGILDIAITNRNGRVGHGVAFIVNNGNWDFHDTAKEISLNTSGSLSETKMRKYQWKTVEILDVILVRDWAPVDLNSVEFPEGDRRKSFDAVLNHQSDDGAESRLVQKSDICWLAACATLGYKLQQHLGLMKKLKCIPILSALYKVLKKQPDNDCEEIDCVEIVTQAITEDVTASGCKMQDGGLPATFLANLEILAQQRKSPVSEATNLDGGGGSDGEGGDVGKVVRQRVHSTRSVTAAARGR